jgi:anaerobic selenocysteine-containing dehydrogenase
MLTTNLTEEGACGVDEAAVTDAWHPTACILCECNCGIEIKLGADGRTFERIHGDKLHPSSAGYTCNKALRLDRYQNGAPDRLTSPLRRRADGTFEEISWDIAVAEVAGRMRDVADQHGGESIFYYGGGGQGNHLGGAYSPATLAAFGGRYRSSALAQEKTGEFWVSARTIGDIPRADVEHCEVAVFVGKNPYQSHGFPRARATLKEIAKDPARSIVVIDPVRTDTAELADFHLQLRPGTDAYLLSAMLGVLVQEDLVDHAWLAAHAQGVEPVTDVLRAVPVGEFAAVCEVGEELLRRTARRIAAASSVALLEDLGVQMNHDSTVVSYLTKLLTLLTGNFAKPGGQYLFSRMATIGRDRGLPADKTPRTPVTGALILGGLVPCNVIPDEILTDHPARFRAMLVESSNPAHSLADGARMREALAALDLLVVVDVAMTETAALADYVLPAATQYEKWEATFFNFEFPRNVFHLRRPVLGAPDGVLPEPEIHARLVEASGALSDADYLPLREAIDRGPEAFGAAFRGAMADPVRRKLASVLLYRTLGPTLPDGAAAAAVLWPAAHECARTSPDGVERAGFGRGPAAGDRLFRAILSSPHGVVITDDEQDAVWSRVGRDRVELHLPELLPTVASLADRERPGADPDWPFVLSAGERRAFTANTIIRDPAWRLRDGTGHLRMSSADAARLAVLDDDLVRVTTRRGSAEVPVEVTDRMRAGHVSLPNGFGLQVTGPDGTVRVGVAPNDLTSIEDRDEWAGTPHHKSVPARVEKV